MLCGMAGIGRRAFVASADGMRATHVSSDWGRDERGKLGLGGDVPIVSTRVREDRDSDNGRHHVVGGARFRGHLYNTLTTCELSSKVKALDTTRSYGIRREKMFQTSK